MLRCLGLLLEKKGGQLGQEPVRNQISSLDLYSPETVVAVDFVVV